MEEHSSIALLEEVMEQLSRPVSRGPLDVFGECPGCGLDMEYAPQEPHHKKCLVARFRKYVQDYKEKYGKV